MHEKLGSRIETPQDLCPPMSLGRSGSVQVNCAVTFINIGDSLSASLIDQLRTSCHVLDQEYASLLGHQSESLTTAIVPTSRNCDATRSWTPNGSMHHEIEACQWAILEVDALQLEGIITDGNTPLCTLGKRKDVFPWRSYLRIVSPTWNIRQYRLRKDYL
jgi:hypothetical protein